MYFEDSYSNCGMDYIYLPDINLSNEKAFAKEIADGIFYDDEAAAGIILLFDRKDNPKMNTNIVSLIEKRGASIKHVLSLDNVDVYAVNTTVTEAEAEEAIGDAW